MQENNKLVQEALIQMRQVEEAIAENAKGILASTMKEEINQLVKESLSEQEEDGIELDMDVEDDMDSDEEDIDLDMDIDNEDEDEDDMDMDFDMDMDSDESPIDLTGASDEEILKVFKAMGEKDGIIVQKDGNDIHLTDNDNDSEYLVKLGESEEEEEMLDEEDDMEFDFEELGEMDDQTTDDVLDAIFAGGSTDDIDSDQDDEEIMFEIEFEDEDEEDFIDEQEEEEEEEDMMDDEEEEDLEESYNLRRAVREAKSTIKPKGVGIGNGPGKTEIKKVAGGFNEKRKEGPKSVGTGKPKFEYKAGANMEGKSKVVKAETKEGDYGMNKGDKSKTFTGDKDYTTKKGDTLKGKAFEKEETKEAAHTYGMGSKEGRGLRKGITPNRNKVYKESTEEVTLLREKNEEYRKALNIFREKLNEVAIFNSNLAYATRLFTEHSTTKKEKINILRRFDDVETLKESKGLYQSIKGELSKPEIKKSLSESVENKIQKTVSTGSSATLLESKTYENPQFLRMKDLMSKLG
jgi:hypothetical protein